MPSTTTVPTVQVPESSSLAIQISTGDGNTATATPTTCPVAGSAQLAVNEGSSWKPNLRRTIEGVVYFANPFDNKKTSVLLDQFEAEQVKDMLPSCPLSDADRASGVLAGASILRSHPDLDTILARQMDTDDKLDAEQQSKFKQEFFGKDSFIDPFDRTTVRTTSVPVTEDTFNAFTQALVAEMTALHKSL